MIVCIAEKPSVAKDIARIIGATKTQQGYIEGNGYQVTWTFGHLCELKEPHEYAPQWKRWDLNYLPMIPPRFGIKLKEDDGIKKQFAIIQKLMQNADGIINCGDAGQEGELIQRWVMQKAGATCPVKRLWISSMTDEAIREGFQNLKDQSEYQKLYHELHPSLYHQIRTEPSGSFHWTCTNPHACIDCSSPTRNREFQTDLFVRAFIQGCKISNAIRKL